MFICKYCNRETESKISNSNHVRRCPGNPDRVMEKLTDEGRKRISQATIKQNKKQWKDQEFRKKHKASMARAVKENPDSYTKNNVCGRVKILEYNGVKLKGQWELRTAKWLDSKKVKWDTEVHPQTYVWNGSDHKYYPDFYLKEYDVYIEVKGYKTDRDDAKWSQFNGTLVIVDKKNIDFLKDYSIIELIQKHQYGPLAQLV